jgi:tetratricopeptide (TPR) repeat protein
MERALALARAGRVAELCRDLGGALSSYHDARSLLVGLHPTPLLAKVLRWEGTVLRDRGELDNAEARYLESMDIAKAAGSLADQAGTTNCLAVVAQRRGRMDEAMSLYGHAARLSREAGEIRLAGMIEQNLGVLANVRGDFVRARQHYEAALEALEEAGDHEGTSWVLNNLGMLHNDLEQPYRAEVTLRRGLAIARGRGDRPLEGILLANLAEGLIATGRWEEASASLDAAFEIACEGEDLARAGQALKFLGVLERERGRTPQALQRFQEALGVAESIQDTLLVGEILFARAELHHLSASDAEAVEDLMSALSAFGTAGAERDAALVRRRLAALGQNGS